MATTEEGRRKSQMMPPYRFDTPPRCKQHVLNEKRTKCHWMLWSRYGRYFTRLELGSSTELTGRTSKRESVPNVYLPLQGWQAFKMPLLSLSLNVMLLTGTVISLQSSCDMDLTYPISQRLRSRDTVLSKSADPSLLVHALLDLSRPPHIDWNWSHSNRHHIVVDKALEVIDQYHVQITKFEHDTLLKPEMQTVRKCTFSMQLLPFIQTFNSFCFSAYLVGWSHSS